jgi:hypothetical protein
MKHLLLFIFAILFTWNLQAQLSVQVYPNDLSYDLQTDLTYEFSEPVAHAWVINTSNETINLRWEREIIGATCPSEWKYKICDDTACYSANTPSNVIFGGGLFKPISLAPGDSTILDIHVVPTLVAGCCTVRINLSHVINANSDTPITSADFDICISPLSSVTEKDKASLRVYPNPTTNYFTLTKNNFVKQLYVSNILGKRVKSFQTTTNGKYDISELPDGIYLVSMVGDNRRVLKTVRVSKRNVRP